MVGMYMESPQGQDGNIQGRNEAIAEVVGNNWLEFNHRFCKEAVRIVDLSVIYPDYSRRNLREEIDEIVSNKWIAMLMLN